MRISILFGKMSTIFAFSNIKRLAGIFPKMNVCVVHIKKEEVSLPPFYQFAAVAVVRIRTPAFGSRTEVARRFSP